MRVGADLLTVCAMVNMSQERRWADSFLLSTLPSITWRPLATDRPRGGRRTSRHPPTHIREREIRNQPGSHSSMRRSKRRVGARSAADRFFYTLVESAGSTTAFRVTFGRAERIHGVSSGLNGRSQGPVRNMQAANLMDEPRKQSQPQRLAFTFASRVVSPQHALNTIGCSSTTRTTAKSRR
jgi:hypothetical protein